MLRITHLLPLILLTGCAASATQMQTPPPNDAVHPLTVTLPIGGQYLLSDGGKITYLQLINDSRCPPNVQCIWAGDAEIELRWQPAKGRPTTFSLHTNPTQDKSSNSFTLGSLRTTLKDLERGIAPKATLQISAVSP